MKAARARFGPPRAGHSALLRQPLRREEDDVQYLGIDWGTRRASWCGRDEHGGLREGAIPADQDGLSRLALTVGTDEEVRGCIEMMSGRSGSATGSRSWGGRSGSPTRGR